MTINNANAIAPKNQTQYPTGNCVHKSFKPTFSFHLLSTSNIEINAFEDVKWLFLIIELEIDQQGWGQIIAEP